MLRWLGILSYLILTLSKGFCQPQICGTVPLMTSFCKDACIICDIDGFTGRNNSSVTGQAPPGFCTSFVHHMQWMGFIAGSTNLTLEVRVSNCQRNNGLEIGLYESLDCNVFRRVSECDTDVRPGETRVFKNTVPLTIGQYYFFVMDGSDNDICDWSIKVTNGSTKVLPLDTPAQIILPEIICQDEVFQMITPGLTGATFYNWTIDGAFTKNGTNVSHSLDKPGKYKICLTASNVCDEAPEVCKLVKVLVTPLGNIPQEICYGECFNFLGKKYCETGKYEIRIPSANGCDSIITLDLLVDDRINASVNLNICEGDTLSLGNGKFFTEGKHQTLIQNQEECDIYMDVNLRLIICKINVEAETVQVKCNGENTGEIRFAVVAGTAPFTYRGIKVENSSIVFEGKIDAVNQIVSIIGVDEGNYSFTIDDSFGNSSIIHVFVAQPSRLTSSSVKSEFNGFQVRCYGEENGSFKIFANGGIPPYTFSHTGYTTSSDSLSNLPSGKYISIVKDQNGCFSEIINDLRQPDILEMEVAYKDPDCSGLSTGMINVSKANGGVPPYLFTLNDHLNQENPTFSGLSEGNYALMLKDKNGCTFDTSVALVAAEIPEISAESESLIVLLGDSIRLNVKSNLNVQSVVWTPDGNLSCKNCLNTFALPVNDTDFEISVTSKDGCVMRKNIFIKVDKRRSFVISNVLTPNGDGSNDHLRYFAGNDISGIRNFTIYDKWGNLVYQNENQDTGLVDIDWDGFFHGQPLLEGIYTWLCQVYYIDDVSITYKGSFTLMR